MGITLAEFDSASGVLTAPAMAIETRDPAHFTLSADGRHLYMCNTGTPGGVSAFSVDRKSGALTLQNYIESRGRGPSYVSVDGSGRFVLDANYGGGYVEVLSLEKDGSLGAQVAFVQQQPYTPEQEAYWRTRVMQLDAPSRAAYDAASRQLWQIDLETALAGFDPIAKLRGERQAKRGGSDIAVDALAMLAFEKSADDIQAGATSAMPGLQMKAVQQSPIDLARAEAAYKAVALIARAQDTW
jgi:hypothetical protein